MQIFPATEVMLQKGMSKLSPLSTVVCNTVVVSENHNKILVARNQPVAMAMGKAQSSGCPFMLWSLQHQGGLPGANNGDVEAVRC